ncbi:unnamed protein product, partial [Prunus brigantina]
AASCFVGGSGHSGGGFPQASSIVRSAISSLTFRRRRPLSRDLVWVALHLGSIALILLLTMLGQHSWAWHPRNALMPDPRLLFSFFLAYCILCRMFSLFCGCAKDYDFIAGLF